MAYCTARSRRKSFHALRCSLSHQVAWRPDRIHFPFLAVFSKRITMLYRMKWDRSAEPLKTTRSRSTVRACQVHRERKRFPTQGCSNSGVLFAADGKSEHRRCKWLHCTPISFSRQSHACNSVDSSVRLRAAVCTRALIPATRLRLVEAGSAWARRRGRPNKSSPSCETAICPCSPNNNLSRCAAL